MSFVGFQAIAWDQKKGFKVLGVFKMLRISLNPWHVPYNAIGYHGILNLIYLSYNHKRNSRNIRVLALKYVGHFFYFVWFHKFIYSFNIMFNSICHSMFHWDSYDTISILIIIREFHWDSCDTILAKRIYFCYWFSYEFIQPKAVKLLQNHSELYKVQCIFPK